MIPAILVWKFYDAPEELRAKSIHGGDEDWLAILPAGYYSINDIPRWMEDGTAFGCCDVSIETLTDTDYKGNILAIGAHA